MRVQLHGQEQNSHARLRNLWKTLSQRCIQRDMPDGFACRTFDTSPKKRTEYACMAENAVVVKHELDEPTRTLRLRGNNCIPWLT